MADLVRVFTCASVIALGGFSATSAMLACSSDPETTPAGDDDDDDDNGGKDAGKTSSSSSSGTMASSSSSTSGGGGDGGGGGNCTIPEGTFTIGKPVYSVTAPGKACDSLAKSGNENAVAFGDVTFAKLPSGNYSAKPAGGGSLTMTQADDICQIAGGLPAGQYTVGVDGKDVDVKVEPSQYYTFEGTKIVARTAFNVDSDPPGAAGIACTYQTLANGIKK